MICHTKNSRFSHAKEINGLPLNISVQSKIIQEFYVDLISQLLCMKDATMIFSGVIRDENIFLIPQLV